jgi:hypothetical protein
MTFENLHVARQIPLVVSAREVADKFEPAASNSSVFRGTLEFQNGATDFHSQPLLARENCLVLPAR